MNRAKAAYINHDFGIGIKAGLLEAPGTQSGYVNVTACVLFDGVPYLGMSTGLEWPTRWVRRAIAEDISIADAAAREGLGGQEIEVHRNGLISIVSKARTSRAEYVREGLVRALDMYENQLLYRSRIVCTVCSREKRPGELLTARERYLGTHVAKVARIAQERQLPLYFLSSRYGCIPESTLVEDYDEILTHDQMNAFAELLTRSLDPGVFAIDLYLKEKKGWLPYGQALGIAAQNREIKLTLHRLDPDD